MRFQSEIQAWIPYATLEPVRELLLQMFMGEKFGRDSIWESHLASELWMTDIEIEAVLDERRMRCAACAMDTHRGGRVAPTQGADVGHQIGHSLCKLV